MFSGATAFNQDITSWDMWRLDNMNNMFNGATAFNQDISIWNIQNPSMTDMFYNATAMHAAYSGTTGFGDTPTQDFFPLFTIKKYTSIPNHMFYNNTPTPSGTYEVQDLGVSYNSGFYMVVSTAQYNEDPNIFSNITLSYSSGNQITWLNEYQTGNFNTIVVGKYTGRAFYLRLDNEGSGTLTFSYTYGDITTSQSFTYSVVL
jgi:hypothetical protein